MDNFSKMVEGVKITIEKMKKTPAELPWYMSVEQLEMTLKELVYWIINNCYIKLKMLQLR